MSVVALDAPIVEELEVVLLLEALVSVPAVAGAAAGAGVATVAGAAAGAVDVAAVVPVVLHAVPDGPPPRLPLFMAFPVAVQPAPGVELWVPAAGAVCARATPPAARDATARRDAKVVFMVMAGTPGWLKRASGLAALMQT